jgi:hypothetical protein
MDYSELRNYHVHNVRCEFLSKKNLRELFEKFRHIPNPVGFSEQELYEKFMKMAASWDGVDDEPIYGQKNHLSYLNENFIKYSFDIINLPAPRRLRLNAEPSRPLDASASLLPRPRVNLKEYVSRRGYDYHNFDDLIREREHGCMIFSQNYG